MIQLLNITKIYRKNAMAEVKAVQDVSLEIKAGEFVAIMGPSGSGKSTLMNIMGCLDKPTSGSYYLYGKEVSKLDDDSLAKIRNQKIGFVFQTFNLLARTNALENVELPLIYSNRTELSRLAPQALEKVGLGDRVHHFPGELSGGEQQRVAIARALVNNPEIIFADEPTGNLDIRSGMEVISILQRLNKDGRTIVLVTHDKDLAEHARRIFSIRDGKIIGDENVQNPRDAKEELNKLPIEKDIEK